MCRGLTLTMFDIDARIDKSDRKLFQQAINPGHSGLGRFRYMTVLVQRSGQFRYVMTSVHMRSISVHVFFVVRLQYMRSTISVHHYVDIGTLQENVCLFMLKVCKC